MMRAYLFASNVQFLLYHYAPIQHAPPSGKLHSQPPNPSRGECYSSVADQIKHLTEIAGKKTGHALFQTHSLFLKLLNNS